jgi:hypothetical protein
VCFANSFAFISSTSPTVICIAFAFELEFTAFAWNDQKIAERVNVKMKNFFIVVGFRINNTLNIINK